MTQLKDTLEIGSHSAETVASQPSGKPKPDSGHSRSDAVSLEVPVKVHGSRVTEATRGTTPRMEPFEEQATTMIVFPQGGVLRMSTAVVAGQAVVLTNLRSQQDAICRILKVRAYSASQSYVELEFTNRQPGYWGVFFPSDGADAPRVVAPVASAPMPEVSVHIPANAERRAPEISMPPAAPPMPVQQADAPAQVKPAGLPQSKLPESHFVSIGAREEVQPAASSTISAHRDSLVESEKKARFAETPKQSAPAAAPIVPPLPVSHASLSMAELRGDAHPAPSMPVPSSAAPVHFESAAPTVPDSAPAEEHSRIASASSHAPKEVFGVRLDSSIGVSAGEEASQGTNWIMIAAAAALALALAGGGLYYYSTRSAKSAANSVGATSTQFSNSNSNTTAAALPANPSVGSVTAPIEQPPATANPPAVSEAPAPSEPISRSRASSSVSVARSSRASSVETEAPQPSAPEHPASSSSLPSTFGALNARPVTSSKHNTDVGAAPSLDTGEAPSVDGALGSIAAPTLAAPEPAKPAANATGPVRVGGNVKPPKIISSTLPDYPSIARNAGVEGAVVIEVVIDKTGKVTGEHAISGPSMLRPPALDAVRHWKYEPSLLDGQPISVEMLVTIQFHR